MYRTLERWLSRREDGYEERQKEIHTNERRRRNRRKRLNAARVRRWQRRHRRKHNRKVRNWMRRKRAKTQCPRHSPQTQMAA